MNLVLLLLLNAIPGGAAPAPTPSASNAPRGAPSENELIGGWAVDTPGGRVTYRFHADHTLEIRGGHAPAGRITWRLQGRTVFVHVEGDTAEGGMDVELLDVDTLRITLGGRPGVFKRLH